MRADRRTLRVLYVTDDRESYKQGNYYVAYQRAFTRQTTVTLAHPLEPLPDPSGFDLVVLGHASIENYARLSGARFLPRVVLRNAWLRHASLRALRGTRTPKIVFTKNDYKDQDLKRAFILFVRPQIAAIQHRSIIPQYAPPDGGRLMWLPFGVDTELFRPPPREVSPDRRTFVLGFRATANDHWVGDLRKRFFAAIEQLTSRYNMSLSLGRAGENFLLGQEYVDWIWSCGLQGNTHSALGAVGPKFLETLACDTPPFAPQHEYEGLLEPHKHYVPAGTATGSFDQVAEAIDRYLRDRAYQQQLRHHGRELVAANSVDEHVRKLLAEVGL